MFFTTLGHPKDFEEESIFWALGRDIPAGGADAKTIGTFVASESFDLSKVK